MAFYDRFKKQIQKAELPADTPSWPAGQGYQPDHQQAHDEAGTQMSQAFDTGDQARNNVSTIMGQLKQAQKVLANCLQSVGTLGEQQNSIRSQYGDDPDESNADKVKAMQGVVDAINQFNDAVHEHLK